MRRSCDCLCSDEVIAVVEIGCVLAASYLAEPSHTHCLAWYRVRPCSDHASAQCPGVLDARPKPRPDYDVRSVVYRRSHGSAHFHAADLDRRLGGPGGGHGGRTAWSWHPNRRGPSGIRPVWAVRRDCGAAGVDFLGFNEKPVAALQSDMMDPSSASREKWRATSASNQRALRGCGRTRLGIPASAGGCVRLPQRADRLGTSGNRQNRPTTAIRCKIVLHTAI